MILQTSARKLAAIAVSGAVLVVGGSAFAEELMPADPVIVEEPAADEPIADEPIADEPIVDEPVIEDTVEEPIVDEPLLDEPTVDEPTVDEPTVDEPELEDTVEEPTVDEPELEEIGDTVEEPVAGARPDNHGAAVSAVAHAPTPEGARNHGEAVSAVARSNAGKPEGRANGKRNDK